MKKDKKQIIVRFSIAVTLMALITAALAIGLSYADPVYMIFIPIILVIYLATGYGFYKEIPIKDVPVRLRGPHTLFISEETNKKIAILPWYPGYLFMDSLIELKACLKDKK